MKKLEELVLPNMELIDRYLSGEMSEHETMRFHSRLEADVELQEDLEMTKSILGYGNTPWWASPRQRQGLGNRYGDANQRRLARKAAIGEDIIGYGLAAVATAAIMAITCAVILYFLG